MRLSKLSIGGWIRYNSKASIKIQSKFGPGPFEITKWKIGDKIVSVRYVLSETLTKIDIPVTEMRVFECAPSLRLVKAD